MTFVHKGTLPLFKDTSSCVLESCNMLDTKGWTCIRFSFLNLTTLSSHVFLTLMLLSGSRLAAHCIECQVFPMGMDSGDALAHQQVALNLIFSHSSHLPPHFYPTPPLKPQLHRSTWSALDATLPNFWLHRYLSFIPKWDLPKWTQMNLRPAGGWGFPLDLLMCTDLQ